MNKENEFKVQRKSENVLSDRKNIIQLINQKLEKKTNEMKAKNVFE